MHDLKLGMWFVARDIMDGRDKALLSKSFQYSS